MTDYDLLYNRVRKIISDSVPLKSDCGELCEKSCCKGDDNTGMILFPGENSVMNITENNGKRFVVCDGKCNRNERPLSCMIFPFFPAIDKNGKIKISIDYRGYSVCPLVSNYSIVKFNRKFLKALKKSAKLMIKDEKCREFMEQTSEEIAETESFILALSKER